MKAGRCDILVHLHAASNWRALCRRWSPGSSSTCRLAASRPAEQRAHNKGRRKTTAAPSDDGHAASSSAGGGAWRSESDLSK